MSSFAAAEWSGPRQRRRVAFTLTAAATIGMTIFTRPTLDFFNRIAAPSAGEFMTRTGEHLEILLADGSRVSLGAKSRLAVDFTDTRRTLRLETGEAYFSVHKDRSRPFTVHALNGAITAVGTEFNVRSIADRVTVAVMEGVVSVQDEARRPSVTSGIDVVSRQLPQAAPAIQRQVKSGQQLIFSAQIPVSSRQTGAAPSSNDRSRWRDGWLVYRNEPLRYVLADVARYTDRRIEISDSHAAELRFSGAVYKSDIYEWISALPESFPVTVDATDDRLAIKAR